MDLKLRFESKLYFLEKKIFRAKQSISYLEKLISQIKKNIKIEEVKQVFIRKQIEVNKIKMLLAEYINELYIYQRHKEVILVKEKSVIKAFQLMEEINDRIVNLIATVQSMIIFLEYSEYKD